MFNITGKFVTVFQPEIQLNVSERIVFANLSTSKKNKGVGGEISYVNMSWKGRFVGDAFEPAKALRNGDKIDITSGAISNRFDKSNGGHLYVDVIIFEFAMSDTNKGKENSSDQAQNTNYGELNGDVPIGGQ